MWSSLVRTRRNSTRTFSRALRTLPPIQALATRKSLAWDSTQPKIFTRTQSSGLRELWNGTSTANGFGESCQPRRTYPVRSTLQLELLPSKLFYSRFPFFPVNCVNLTDFVLDSSSRTQHLASPAAKREVGWPTG